MAVSMRDRLKTFERTVTGQVVISIGLLVTVGAIVIGNLPDSGLKATLGAATQPILNASGLQQQWGVFAEPRTVSAYVDARLDFADGSAATYPIPDSPGSAAYVDYRWQKYEEMIRPDDGKSLWASYADYLANQARAQGRDPVRVTLIRRWADTLPPGPGPERGPWQQAVMAAFPMETRTPR
jgi:hypothetical protein